MVPAVEPPLVPRSAAGTTCGTTFRSWYHTWYRLRYDKRYRLQNVVPEAARPNTVPHVVPAAVPQLVLAAVPQGTGCRTVYGTGCRDLAAGTLWYRLLHRYHVPQPVPPAVVPHVVLVPHFPWYRKCGTAAVLPYRLRYRRPAAVPGTGCGTGTRTWYQSCGTTAGTSNQLYRYRLYRLR